MLIEIYIFFTLPQSKCCLLKRKKSGTAGFTDEYFWTFFTVGCYCMCERSVVSICIKCLQKFLSNYLPSWWQVVSMADWCSRCFGGVMVSWLLKVQALRVQSVQRQSKALTQTSVVEIQCYKPTNKHTYRLSLLTQLIVMQWRSEIDTTVFFNYRPFLFLLHNKVELQTILWKLSGDYFRFYLESKTPEIDLGSDLTDILRLAG